MEGERFLSLPGVWCLPTLFSSPFTPAPQVNSHKEVAKTRWRVNNILSHVDKRDIQWWVYNLSRCLFVCFCLRNMLKSFINRTWTKHIISEMLFYIVLLNPWQYNDHSFSRTELVESIGQAHSLFHKRKKSSFTDHFYFKIIIKQNINKRQIDGHIYLPVFLSRKWLYHIIAFPFSGLTIRLLLWQFWARLHFQPSPFSQACQKNDRRQVLMIVKIPKLYLCDKTRYFTSIWDASPSQDNSKNWHFVSLLQQKTSVFFWVERGTVWIRLFYLTKLYLLHYLSYLTWRKGYNSILVHILIKTTKTWPYGWLFIRRKWTTNNCYVHVTSTLPTLMRHVARQWSWPRHFHLGLSQSSRCHEKQFVVLSIEWLLCSYNHSFSAIPLLKTCRCLREGMQSLRLFRVRLGTARQWQVCNIAIIKL